MTLTQEQAIKLGERALAVEKHWRPMQGMTSTDGFTVTKVCDDGSVWGASNDGIYHHRPIFGIPDFRDPATMGCLLALVREAYDDPGLWSVVYGQGWAYEYDVDQQVGFFPTEAHSLVAALENAP